MISVGTLTCLLQTQLAVYSPQLLVIIRFMSGMLLLGGYVAHTGLYAVDEITAAFSVAFNPAGNKIFAGYNKTIRVFDVHRPGRDFEMHSTLQGNKEGQTVIISAIAFSPAHTGMLASGSYSQTTAICREDNVELLYILCSQQGGVTHVLFSKDGNYLYAGGWKIQEMVSLSTHFCQWLLIFRALTI